MKIASWNINSIRARISHCNDFIAEYNPDLIMLQETKCLNEVFPEEELNIGNYNIYLHGQKSYNGVAIFSKTPADEIKTDFEGNPCTDQARFIEVSFNSDKYGYCRFINLYAPNGGEVGSDKFQLKFKFYESFIKYIEKILSFNETLIIGGDFNIAPFDIDISKKYFDSRGTCCTQEEQQLMRKLLNLGLIDTYRFLNPDDCEFSWWDYRAGAFEQNHGLRIDTILSSPRINSHLGESKIIYELRGKPKSSDHAPIITVLK